MKTRYVKSALAAAALAVAVIAAPATAQDTEDPNQPTDVDRECIMGCRATERDCRFDAREAFKLCLEEAGCDVLAADYRAACLVEDRDEEACPAARTALRECRAPCHEAAAEANAGCREAFRTCVTETCGLDELSRPPRGPHGHGGPRRPGGFRGPR
jgi:hypothetical protein